MADVRHEALEPAEDLVLVFHFLSAGLFKGLRDVDWGVLVFVGCRRASTFNVAHSSGHPGRVLTDGRRRGRLGCFHASLGSLVES